MSRIEVQMVKRVTPEWIDNVSVYMKKVDVMYEEMKEFVDETREAISKHQKLIEKEQQHAVEVNNKLEELRQIQSDFLNELTQKLDQFIEAHEQRHENEKGILKKIFGR